jgi:predicted TIM-barrel fold metal-dependent hydrolase
MSELSAAGRQPVFDFSARLGPDPEAPGRLLSTMDRWCIDRAVVSAGGMIGLDELSRQVLEGGHVEVDADNDAVLAGCERSEGRLVPFFFANPHRDPGEYRRQAARFRGLEISPAVHGVTLVDRRTHALVEVAGEARHSVYVVCLLRPECGAADLVALARTYPEITFVLGHCGFTNIDVHWINLIAPQANVVIETSGGYSGVVGIALARLGADRVLFGTEYPLQHPSVELAKFQALELSPECWAKVAWDNARRLLGED